MGFFNRFIRLFAVSMALMIPLRVLSESVDSLKTKQVITINKVKEIKTMKIVYWSDYACPYCYIGETRLKKAIKELGLENEVEIETRAFELDPKLLLGKVLREPVRSFTSVCSTEAPASTLI